MEKIRQIVNNKKVKILLISIVLFFACIGLLFTFVFVGMRLKLFDVRGSIDSRNNFYLINTTDKTSENIHDEMVNLITRNGGANVLSSRKIILPDTSFSWVDTPEWQTLREALKKDKEVIDNVSKISGVNSRLIVSVVIAEQIRFFTSNRESYKKFFEPLKILGTLSNFSLGVSGIKPETAKQIEDNLKDVNSPFYISKNYENILDYNLNENPDDTLYNRLTDDKNHFYSYLYTALFIKQVETQWKKAGFDISKRPEILATLFNLGFSKSNPKSNPEVAGSLIEIGKEKISFGRLAYEFYFSGELIEEFNFIFSKK